MAASGPPVLLGIDLGTSSAKAVLVDLDARVLGSASAAYPVEHPGPGWAESDPAQWWAAVVGSVRQAIAATPAEPVAVGLSGQMHGVVATEASGRAVRPAVLWSDTRATDQLVVYRSLPGSVRVRLGNPLSPGMAGPILGWLAEHEPATMAATRWALQPKDWLRARLTGRFAAEPTDASATLLFDLLGQAWDTDVVAALGLDGALLAPLLGAAGAFAGELQPKAAAELGLPPGLPVAAGAADTAAAALGSGLVEVGAAQLTIGTGAQVVTPAHAPGSGLAPDPVTHLYRSATDEGWYAMAAGLNGGLVLDWVRRLLGVSWGELYATASLPAALDDPFFLPHLSGERTPYLDPAMRGAWVGLSPRHDRARLLRAALEGVAFAVRDATDALRSADRALDDLRLAGGGTADPGWRQLLANVLNARLRIVDTAAASGRGAALLGARAAGLLDEPALLARLPAAAEPSVFPQPAEVARYEERFTAFRRAVVALRSPALGPRTTP